MKEKVVDLLYVTLSYKDLEISLNDICHSKLGTIDEPPMASYR